MRGSVLLTAALASLAAACGSHKHDDHEWTAEELAELERKWGMEVRKLFSLSLFNSSPGSTQTPPEASVWCGILFPPSSSGYIGLVLRTRDPEDRRGGVARSTLFSLVSEA